jgi:hypothetical protein
MKTGFSLAAATVALCGLASIAAADVLYTQAPHVPGTAGANGLSTFYGALSPGGPIYDRQIGDDFIVSDPAGWSINRISISAVQSTVGDPNPVTGAAIRFFSISGGTVGSLLATANVTGTTRTTGPGTYFSRPEQILSFDLDPVNLAAGTYFVQIQPLVDANWFWLTSSPSTPIAGSAAQIQRGPATDPTLDLTWPAVWTPVGPGNAVFTAASDQSMKIEGTIIPAPGTLALLAFGGLVGARRRR